MSIAQTVTTLSDHAESLVGTKTIGDEALAGTPDDVSKNRHAWQEMIDRYLVEWGRDPSQLEDEGVLPPSEAIIQRACRVAMSLRDKGTAAPLRVVADGEGGISFERKHGCCFQTLDILEDGTIEIATFRNCRLERRQRLF